MSKVPKIQFSFKISYLSAKKTLACNVLHNCWSCHVCSKPKIKFKTAKNIQCLYFWHGEIGGEKFHLSEIKISFRTKNVIAVLHKDKVGLSKSKS